MNHKPVLYLAVAEPLVEVFQLWQASAPPAENAQELQAKLREFPKNLIAAYGLEFPNAPDDYTQFIFRTSTAVQSGRVEHAIIDWSGKPPQRLGAREISEVSRIEQRKLRNDFRQALNDGQVQLIERVGLTLQQLQRDLAMYQPEIVLLLCHGTKEGCVYLEDGTGAADVVSGPRLLAALQPRPQVLFLSACHSERILERAQLDTTTQNSTIVYVSGAETLAVTCTVRFGTEFIQALLRGQNAGDAFQLAQGIVANDPGIGDLAVLPSQTPESQKLQLNTSGRDNVLQTTRQTEVTAPASLPYHPDAMLTRRRAAHFIGRRRERWQVISTLQGRPTGIANSPDGQDKRLMTLTKEGGIGKTALALRTVDWCRERGLFPGGILELSCETLRSSSELLNALLELLGAPPETRRGDLKGLLATLAGQVIGEQNRLLLLDNLDDLARESDTAALLEILLGAGPNLKILATCRWPLGVHEEYPLEVTPLSDDDALHVLADAVEHSQHRAQILAQRKQPGSSAYKLVRLSGRHPQSLRLLARQLARPGLTLEALCQEAEQDLMQTLTDPLAAENEQDRLKKVEVSYELSYRHLSPAAQRLFQRLSFLPGGVWCGEFPERFLNWAELLGPDWRKLLEKELDYYALLHYEPDPHDEGVGTFEMLPPMLEFARKKYQQQPDSEWEQAWLDFWLKRLDAWDDLLSGKLPEDIELPDEQRAEVSHKAQMAAKHLFEQCYSNWRTVFDYCEQQQPDKLDFVLLNTVNYTDLSDNRLLGRELAERAVKGLRPLNDDEKLAACLVVLGSRHRNLGERQDAHDAYNEALTLYRRLAQQHPVAFEPQVATTLNNMGNVLRDLGQRQDARHTFDEALSIRRRLAQQYRTTFEPDVAMTLNNLGNVLGDLGEHQAAQTVHNEALEICWPYFQQYPQAYAQNFRIYLRNYLKTTEETPDNRWWQVAKPLLDDDERDTD